MMAARGNAAKKMQEQHKKDKKRDSKIDVISQEVRRDQSAKHYFFTIILHTTN
jgi:hypothetical protein